jgi:RNA polymerase sigma-54 factor
MYLAHLQDNRPQATAHLAKTMGYLQLAAADLESTLRDELEKNPALELVEELRCPNCGRRLHRLPCPACAAPTGDGSPVVFLSPRQPAGLRREEREDGDLPEPGVPERLDEYILRQIGPALSLVERPIAAYLLAQLDDNGLLTEPLAEIAAYRRLSLSQVQRVLDLIQHADPPGVGARDPRESLLIQLDSLADLAAADGCQPAAGRGPNMLELARLLIRDHFEALGRMEYDRIARRLRVDHDLYLPPGAIEAAVQFIQRNLTPYPARAYWGDGKAPANLDGAAPHNPDVNITTLESDGSSTLAVEVFTPLSGWLRVNPDFKAAVADCSGEDRERWSQAVAEAALVTKCLQQRNHTMRRLMQIIAEGQRDFILGGALPLGCRSPRPWACTSPPSPARWRARPWRCPAAAWCPWRASSTAASRCATACVR